MRTLTSREKRLLIYFALFCGVLGWDCLRRRWSPDVTVETEHYLIRSSATAEQTPEIAQVAEIVYQGYLQLIGDLRRKVQHHDKHKIKLFRDREEFRRCNRVFGWAEAFYRRPYCYQYYSADEAHPYHWLMHEATHQLNAEAAGLKLPQWLDEGLACYVSTSRIIDNSLRLGEVDTNTYPVWWLDSVSWSGDLAADIAGGDIIPLRVIVSGKGGPSINRHVNLYYLHWWSLVHFLMQHENGAYRSGLSRLLAGDASPAAFEKHLGPLQEVQAQWYAHLLALQRQLASQTTPRVRLTRPNEETPAKEPSADVLP